MKRTFAAVLMGALVAPLAMAQQETVPITSFEESPEWAWTGGNIIDSFVDVPFDTTAPDGELALGVFYENGSVWNYQSMSFPIDPVDISGMREIRMSVYFTDSSTGDMQIRLDLPGGDFMPLTGIPTDDEGNYITGEWHELSFPMDRYMSQRATAVDSLQGFIVPTPAGAVGEVWIDNVYAALPEDIPEVEEVLLYGFNESDPDNGAPMGWTAAEGDMPEMSDGFVEPTEGDNAMVMFAMGSSSTDNVQSINAAEHFDNWSAVREIIYDIRLVEDVPGGWIQNRLVLESGITGDEESVVRTENKEIGYTGTTEEWKTLAYDVDMTPHLDNIADPNGYLEIIITPAHSGDAAGTFIVVDNMRLGVAVGETRVSDWNLF